VWLSDLWVEEFWEQAVELKHLEFAQLWGLEQLIEGTRSALEVARRDAEVVNVAIVAGEDGSRKVEIISHRFSTAVESERSPLSSHV
jgi:hypothetical protein